MPPHIYKDEPVKIPQFRSETVDDTALQAVLVSDPERRSRSFSPVEFDRRASVRASIALRAGLGHNPAPAGTPSWWTWSLPCSPLQLCDRILRNKLFLLINTALTVYVLVGDDIRLMSFKKEHDWTFNVITLTCLTLFSIEILLSSIAKEDYLFGFWFFADIIASASLIFDLTWMPGPMMSLSISIESAQENRAPDTVQEAEYARAGRSGRVGTRVARIMRVARLVRLGNILQIFHWYFMANKSTTNHGRTRPGEPPADVHEDHEESRVGRKLSERTTQRVILLVLAMVACIPQLSPESDHDMISASSAYGANVVFQLWLDYKFAVLANSSDMGQRRREWEMQILMYIYYHGWATHCDQQGDFCVQSYLLKLAWIGYVFRRNAPPSAYNFSVWMNGYIDQLAPDIADWEAMFVNVNNRPYMGQRLPFSIQQALTGRWSTDCSESGNRILGTSLLEGMPCPRLGLRLEETTWYTPKIQDRGAFNEHMDAQFIFVFDTRRLVKLKAIMNILQTVFLIIVLAFSAMLFTRDSDQLVLLPIERMMKRVEKLRDNPLYAIKMGERKRRSSRKKLLRQDSTDLAHRLKLRKSSTKKALETKILENAIIKLGSLLALGFGEAGSEIIGHNLDDENASVSVTIPGSKVEAIYGFCSIRSFGDTIDVLQEKTMVFVNQVADIVHRIVDEYLGAANKNVGEAFLLVWRLGMYHHDLRPKMADLAVMSFVQVIAEINRDHQLSVYRSDPRLVSHVCSKFRVTLGFGLHLGWAIEGAIGSEFKIDASYLSPHVNISSGLEGLTTEYGVLILMSEPLVRCCNVPFSRQFRPVDHIKLPGSKLPMRIFTVDLCPEALPVDTAVTDKIKRTAPRYQGRQVRETLKDVHLMSSYQVWKKFERDMYVQRMRERYSNEFFQLFERGYLNYEAGEWGVASDVFRMTQNMLGKVAGVIFKDQSLLDGPSSALLDYMQTLDFQAPPGWPGWRELSDHVQSTASLASVATE